DPHTSEQLRHNGPAADDVFEGVLRPVFIPSELGQMRKSNSPFDQHQSKFLWGGCRNLCFEICVARIGVHGLMPLARGGWDQTACNRRDGRPTRKDGGLSFTSARRLAYLEPPPPTGEMY